MQLRLLEGEYIKLDRNTKNTMCYNKDSNNLIVAESSVKISTTKDIFNWLEDKAYNYILSELNTKKNIIAYFYRDSEVTTSSFVVYYDFDPLKFINFPHRKVVCFLKNLVLGNHYYYVAVENGYCKPLFLHGISCCNYDPEKPWKVGEKCPY